MTKAKEEENRLWKLRNRVSYTRWKEAYIRFRKLGLSHKKCLHAMEITDDFVNTYKGYSTATGAYYSHESMEQVAEDMKRADRKGA